MKFKAGFLIGYNGKGYSGLQYNKDLNTIEKAIAECLGYIGAISNKNASDPSKIHLKSSSRTDKGVHASLNLVCAKIETEVTEKLTLELKNKLENRGIILYKVLRLTKGFIPSKKTSSRLYEYVIPTYILQESNFLEEIKVQFENDQLLDKTKKRIYLEEDLKVFVDYKSLEKDLQSFKKILCNFIGMRDYHNFTTIANPKGKVRFIKSVDLTEPYIKDDIEYVKVLIEGQSFLLHQIRKMIYFAILLCRYKRGTFLDTFNQAFTNSKMHIPKGPSEYLLLDKPLFMELKDKGKMTDDLNVDENMRIAFKADVIYAEIHDKMNLIKLLSCLDSTRFHNEQMSYLK